MFKKTLKHYLTVVLAFLFVPHISSSQIREHLSKDTLTALLPKEIGDYKLDQISVAPDFVTPENSIILNGLYTTEGDNAFFIQLGHYQDYDQRKDANMWDSKDYTTFKGYPSFRKASMPTVSVYLGDRFDVKAYKAGGEIDTASLHNALEFIDFKRLEKLLNIDKKETEEENIPAEEITLKEIDCNAFNSDLKEQMKKQMGAKLVPWIHFLKEKQAGTAKIQDDKIVFPKKGNDWLLCVKKNDILWSPLDMPMFLLRVKEIEEKPDRFIFKTEKNGFDDVIIKGKVEMKAGDN